MVGPHPVDGAVGQARPEQFLVGFGPKGRVDLPPGAERHVLVQHQILGAGLHVERRVAVPGGAEEFGAAAHAGVDHAQRSSGVLGEDAGADDRLLFGEVRAVVAPGGRVGGVGVGGDALFSVVEDHVDVLGVDQRHHPGAGGNLAHAFVDQPVVETHDPVPGLGSLHCHVELIRGEAQLVDGLGNLGDLPGVGYQAVKALVDKAVLFDVGDMLGVGVLEGTARQQVVPHGGHAPGDGRGALGSTGVRKRQDHSEVHMRIDGAGNHIGALGVYDPVGGGRVGRGKERLDDSIAAMDGGSGAAGRADQGGVFDR